VDTDLYKGQQLGLGCHQLEFWWMPHSVLQSQTISAASGGGGKQKRKKTAAAAAAAAAATAASARDSGSSQSCIWPLNLRHGWIQPRMSEPVFCAPLYAAVAQSGSASKLYQQLWWNCGEAPLSSAVLWPNRYIYCSVVLIQLHGPKETALPKYFC